MKQILAFCITLLLSVAASAQCLKAVYTCSDMHFDKRGEYGFPQLKGLSLDEISLKYSMTFNGKYALLNLDSFKLSKPSHDNFSNHSNYVTSVQQFVDLQSKRIIIKSAAAKENMVGVDYLSTSKFNINDEYTYFNGLKCRSASFKENDLVKIWFSDQIPYPLGPNREFMGLPGIVVKVSVSNNEIYTLDDIIVLKNDECSYLQEKFIELDKLEGAQFDNYHEWTNPRGFKKNPNHIVDSETEVGKWYPVKAL